MRDLLHKTYQNRIFLLFILLFAYVQSIYIRISIRQKLDAYIFTPEAALFNLLNVGILILIILYFIKKWKAKEDLIRSDIPKIFTISLLSYISIIVLIDFIVALVFGNIERNFNSQSFLISILSTFLNGLIYGSFFLAYYFFKLNKEQHQQILKTNNALAEGKINQLKAQLNPHFLFNNLNILDQLIEEDKHEASTFLNEFADIYRYVLQASDKELISINEELDFAQHYFNLIQHKYGKAYQLSVIKPNKVGFIVPLTLQLLIENAIQHNLGTEENPIRIRLEITDAVRVLNTINLKKNNKKTAGRALNNLKEQYNILSEEAIEIKQTQNEFAVIIPIIPNSKK